jgi:hypothetical protein
LSVVIIFVIAIGTLWAKWLNSYTTRPQFAQWQFTPVTGTQGTPLCAIYSGVVNARSQNIVIKGFKGKERYFVVSLYDITWARRQGHAGELTFTLSGTEPLVLPADGNGHFLEARIPTQYIALFLLGVADGVFTIDLPQDENESWIVNATGAKPAIKSMMSCMGVGG